MAGTLDEYRQRADGSHLAIAFRDATQRPTHVAVLGRSTTWIEGLTLVDTGVPGSAETILNSIESLGRRPVHIREIMLTHFHRDHSGSVATLVQCTGASVLAHPVDAGIIAHRMPPPPPSLTELERPLAEQLFGDVATVPGPQPAAVVVDGEVDDGAVTLGGGTIVGVPGHTPGSLALHLPQLGVLLTGDTIAAYEDAPILGPFNVDRLGAIEAVRKLARLEFDVACVGHGRPIVTNAGGKLLAMARSL